MGRFRIGSFLFTGMLFFLAAPLSAQITGSVRGTVVDAADATVSTGTATLRSVDTGTERPPQSLTDAGFAFDLLPVGLYQVRVEAQGFRVTIAEAEVKAGEIATLRIRMEIGAVTETITVTDAVSLLDLESSQIQMSFTGAQIQEIPTQRDPNAFALSAPGVAPVTANNPFLGSGSFNVNGMRGRGNNITIDGITSTDVSVTGTDGQLISLNFASIKEVKIITNNFSAEYGRNMGSQVLYLTQSGSNKLHGEAYEYFQNDKLNARPFFDTSGKAAILRRNEYGFALGGPVMLPGYDGRDKSFWHADWGQVKTRGAGAPVIANVPTPAMMAQITDPTSLALVQQYQLPSSPTGQANFSAANTTDRNLWSIRGDQYFGPKAMVWGRFAKGTSTAEDAGLTFIGSNLPGFGALSSGPVTQASAGYTQTFSPVVVNEVRYGYGKSIAEFPINSPYPLGPRVIFGDASVDRFGLWEGLPQGRDQRTQQFSDNLSWSKGSHSLKFGGEFFRLDANNQLDSLTRGVYTFANWANFATGIPQMYQQRFGDSLRRFRVHNFFAFAQDDWKVNRNLTLNLGIRMEYAGGPVEKDGRISVLDFSDQTPYGAAGAGPFGNFVVGEPAFKGNTNWAPRLGFAWTTNDQKTVVRGGYGIAYDFIFMNPITNGRTLPPLIVTGQLSGAANFTGNNSWGNLVAGTSTIQAETAAQVGTVSTTVLNFGSASPIINPDLKNPQAQTWNLGVEREVAGTVFKLTYVGTKGNYLLRSRDLNYVANPAAPATSVTDETARLAEFQAVFAGLNGGATSRSNRFDGRYNTVSFVDNSASSNYHAMQFEVIRRFGTYDIRGNWTLGKSLDNGSDALNVLINDGPNQQNPFNNADNYGPSQFDLRQRLVITHTWTMPFFRNSNAFTRAVLGGWVFSGVTSFRTGFPVTLDAGTRRGIAPIPNIGVGAQVRPNVAGPVGIEWVPSGAAGAPAGLTSGSVQNISAYASSLGLSQPLLGNFGTMGRNVLRLNGERNFNWTIGKAFVIREGMNLQIRSEFYNVFNNTAFQDVNRNISNTNFGQYTSVAQDARLIQLVGRFIF